VTTFITISIITQTLCRDNLTKKFLTSISECGKVPLDYEPNKLKCGFTNCSYSRRSVMSTEDKIVLGPPKKKKSKKVEKKEINKDMLREFVCNNVDDTTIKLLFRIDQTPITADEFRINVWTKYTEGDRVVASTKIASSFFVELLPNGEIIDRTINA